MKIKFKKFNFSLLFLFLLSFLYFSPLYAQDSGSTQTSDNQMLNKLETIAKDGGYATGSEAASAPKVVGQVINAFTSILGIIFVILIVVAGFTWMTSSGNEEKIKKATATIKSATIGLVLTLSAWVIWRFIFDRLINK